MQAAERKIAFICFHFLLLIETFQSVTGEKIKKFSSAAARAESCGPALQTATTSRLSALPEEIPLVGRYSDNFRFCQEDEVQAAVMTAASRAARRAVPKAKRPVDREAHARGMAEPDGRR